MRLTSTQTEFRLRQTEKLSKVNLLSVGWLGIGETGSADVDEYLDSSGQVSMHRYSECRRVRQSLLRRLTQSWRHEQVSRRRLSGTGVSCRVSRRLVP